MGGADNSRNFAAEGEPFLAKSPADLVPGFGDFQPGGRSGWLRFWTIEDVPVLGAAMTSQGAKLLSAESFSKAGVLSFVPTGGCIPPASRHQTDLALIANSQINTTAIQGQNVTFKFRVANNGPDAASAALAVNLDAKLKVLSCKDEAGSACPRPAPRACWSSILLTLP